jgi:hypothetical protein
MRVFLEKEKKYKQALLFVAWSICKEIERDRSNIQDSIDFARKHRVRSFRENTGSAKTQGQVFPCRIAELNK